MKEIVLLSGISLFAVCPVAAWAQDDSGARAPSSAGLGEIVVTAQKRAESLQDTPISIAAFSGKDLENRGVTSLGDLGAGVPNVQIAPGATSPNTVVVMVRGIGQQDNTVSRDAPVAIYQDGVYLGRAQGMGNELADLERVEVLRGPQGTLYGRNATAGAINFISRPPRLGKFGFEQKFTIGRYDEFRSRSSVNIPVGDSLAFELTYLRAKRDGFVKNIGTGEPSYGSTDRNAVRAAVLWKPSDAFEARYTYDSTWIDDTSHFIALVPLYPAKAKRPHKGSPFVHDLEPDDTRVQGHNLTLTYEVSDNLTIKSITGYRKLNGVERQQYNVGVAGPYPTIKLSDATDQKQFSEELQLIGNAIDGRLKYILGAYYFKESGRSLNVSTTPTYVNPRAVSFKNSAYAVFGQGTFTPDFLDGRLHLTLGARWSHDKRDASILSIRTNTGETPVTLIDGSGKRSFSDFAPSGVIQFDINDDVNIYGKIAKGYKTGGFSLTASTPQTFARGFGPEKVLSYEAGLRSEWFDRRIRFNLTGFYNDYTDIQTNVFDPANPRLFDVINAGKAVTKGIELDVAALLFKGFTVRGGYGYTDAKYKKVIDLGGNNVTSSFFFVHAPKNSFSLGADYTSPQTPVGTFDASISYDWQDKFIALVTGPTYIIRSNGLLGATVGLSDVGGVEGLRIAVWGRNLTDESYYVRHFSSGFVNAVFGEPRTYGVDVTVKF